MKSAASADLCPDENRLDRGRSRGQLTNPFATRWTTPAALAYQFDDGNSLAVLLDRLRVNRWWGQIVGPHGSGKTTLVAALATELQKRGRRVASIALHDGQRCPDLDWDSIAGAAQPLQLIVDGYEQLSWWWRWRVQLQCRRRGCGLLITSHKSAGLPVVAQITPSLELAQRLVARLTKNHVSLVTPVDVREAFTASGGNLREMLFELFDRHAGRMGGPMGNGTPAQTLPHSAAEFDGSGARVHTDR